MLKYGQINVVISKELEDHIEHARQTRQRKKYEAARDAGQLELF